MKNIVASKACERFATSCMQDRNTNCITKIYYCNIIIIQQLKYKSTVTAGRNLKLKLQKTAYLAAILKHNYFKTENLKNYRACFLMLRVVFFLQFYSL